MATYTYQQLYGTGSIGENLSGLKTFTFTNPSASSYFVMETITTSSFYNNSSPTNFQGTYSVSQSMGLVTSSYIAGVVVQPGVSSFTFTPTYTIVSGSNYYLRGTGMYSLTIS
jgi:hypothetical protein